MVDTNVAIMVAPTISVGAIESYFIRIAIMVVGINVTLDVFSAKNVIIDREASGRS